MNYLILKIRIKIDRHHVLTDFFPGTVPQGTSHPKQSLKEEKKKKEISKRKEKKNEIGKEKKTSHLPQGTSHRSGRKEKKRN